MRIIAGRYKGRQLKTTTGPGLRPAMGKVRESLFSMLEARGVDWPATRVLDLFAGSGSLGFEALSRGAEHVSFVELAPYAVKVLQKNVDLLGLSDEAVSIRQEAAHRTLAKRPLEPFSLVFIDPPYQLHCLGQCLELLLHNKWLASGAILNAEVPVKGQCKELHAYPELELLADRAYGQTRVLLWNVNQ